MRGRWLYDQSGTALVEFVVVASTLFLITFALVDFGFLINQKLVITHAAREGARRAAIDGGRSTRAVETILEQLELGGLNGEEAEISIQPQNAQYGTPITVQLAADYRPVTPVFHQLGLDRIRLAVEMVSRSERLQEGEP